MLLVVALDQGPIGVIVGNFTGTLLVYAALVGYRREQLGLQFDRGLLREMNRFGVPLIPTALFLWVTNFSDRIFLVRLADTDEVGLYSVGVRIASAMVLLLTAFRLAWPAFAYSIEDEGEAKRTYAYVLTYLVLLTTWVAAALALLSPWIVDWIAAPAFAESSRVVGPLAFAAVAFGAYIVVAIGVGRARRTQFNWVVTGAAAAVNIALNLILIPRYGMMGAAVATIAAYATMFAGMSWWAQRIYPVPYQWRRVLTAALVWGDTRRSRASCSTCLCLSRCLLASCIRSCFFLSASTSPPSGARSALGYGRRVREETAATAASTCSGVFTIPGPSRT